MRLLKERVCGKAKRRKRRGIERVNQKRVDWLKRIERLRVWRKRRGVERRVWVERSMKSVL